MADVYTAKNAFATIHDGKRVHVRAGDTAAADHWLVAANPEAFEPQKVTFPAAAKAPAARK